MTMTPTGIVATLATRDGIPVGGGAPPVARAKLTPPRLPTPLVAGSRFRRWLDQVEAHDVTLVTAPLRYGKTVFAALIHAEAVDSGFLSGWVSCSGIASARVIDHIVEALRIDSAHATATDPLILANHLHGLGKPVLLCLDDADLIDDPDAIGFLGDLVDHAPANFHLLCTCRDEARLPRSLREHRGTVLRAGRGTLRARDAEVTEYFERVGRPIGLAPARALNAVLDGWWGALHHVSAALRDEGWQVGTVDWAPRCGSAIAPLFGDLLAAMPTQHRATLEHCAITPIASGSLAILLSGDEAASDVLHALTRSTPFVTAIAGQRDRYALHPALRAALMATHRDSVQAAMAINWHVAAGEIDHALAIAGAFGLEPVVATLLVDHGRTQLFRSGPGMIADALARLPRATVADRPALQKLSDDVQALSGNVATRGGGAEPLAIVRRIAEAQAQLATGDRRAAVATLHPILLPARSDGIGYAEALATVVMSDLHRAEGRPADAEALLQDAMARLAAGVARRSDTVAVLAIALADMRYMRNDMAAAGRLADEFLPLLRGAALAGLLARGYRVAIRIAAAAGRMTEALALIEAAEAIASDRAMPLLTALGAVERMRLHIPLATPLDDILPPDGEAEAIADPAADNAALFVLLSEARVFEAITQLDRPRLTVVAMRLIDLAERSDHAEWRIIGSLFNVLPQLSGRCDRLIEMDTVQALNRAASNGFVRPMVDLLEITGVRTSQDFNRTEYSVGSFLALLRLSRPYGLQPANNGGSAGSAFSLFTARELEIVEALGAGETNKEIARSLSLTPETVKWHMKSLMRKLRASNREEVVSNAMMLGLPVIERG